MCPRELHGQSVLLCVVAESQRTFFLAVEVDDRRKVVTIFALVSAGAKALGKVKANGLAAFLAVGRVRSLLSERWAAVHLLACLQQSVE